MCIGGERAKKLGSLTVEMLLCVRALKVLSSLLSLPADPQPPQAHTHPPSQPLSLCSRLALVWLSLPLFGNIPVMLQGTAPTLYPVKNFHSHIPCPATFNTCTARAWVPLLGL